MVPDPGGEDFIVTAPDAAPFFPPGFGRANVTAADADFFAPGGTGGRFRVTVPEAALPAFGLGAFRPIVTAPDAAPLFPPRFARVTAPEADLPAFGLGAFPLRVTAADAAGFFPAVVFFGFLPVLAAAGRAAPPTTFLAGFFNFEPPRFGEADGFFAEAGLTFFDPLEPAAVLEVGFLVLEDFPAGFFVTFFDAAGDFFFPAVFFPPLFLGAVFFAPVFFFTVGFFRAVNCFFDPGFLLLRDADPRLDSGFGIITFSPNFSIGSGSETV